ncbi:MAG: hypothetical protein IPI20_20285 [Rhodoferax sp.]|nr:hypothetical protein [Rhodoferax sp.]
MQTSQWVLVACAPRMTRHISKWVSHSLRELACQLERKKKLFAQIVPIFQGPGRYGRNRGAGPLPTLTERLLTQHRSAVLDARHAKFGQDLPRSPKTNPPGTTAAGCAGEWPAWVRCWLASD